MDTAEICGMLRVKNEARWIAEVLAAIQPACKHIFVMDDHSADDTARIAGHCGATVLNSPFEGMDEARDKDWLLDHIGAVVPEGSWVLCVDGDEVLEADGTRKIEEAIASSRAAAYSLRVLYMWNNRETVRTDGVYGRFRRPSLFRIDQRAMTFRRTGVHGNLHCSSVPAAYISRTTPCNAALLHLGYMEREDRLRKFEFYRSIDRNNSAEDGYRHMILGDLPEYPASMKRIHGGPLKIEALCAPVS